MSWRKQETHKSETKAVKAALTAAGLKVLKVGHGKGTAWGWLHVTLQETRLTHSVDVDGKIVEMTRDEKNCPAYYGLCISGCPACMDEEARMQKAYRLIADVTGRSGDYNGEVNIGFRKEAVPC